MNLAPPSDLSGNVTVVITGVVDTNTIGVYTVTYTSTDASGNAGTATRTVNVVADDDSGTSWDRTGALELELELDLELELGQELMQHIESEFLFINEFNKARYCKKYLAFK